MSAFSSHGSFFVRDKLLIGQCFSLNLPLESSLCSRREPFHVSVPYTSESPLGRNIVSLDTLHITGRFCEHGEDRQTNPFLRTQRSSKGSDAPSRHCACYYLRFRDSKICLKQRSTVWQRISSPNLSDATVTGTGEYYRQHVLRVRDELLLAYGVCLPRRYRVYKLTRNRKQE